MQIDSNGTVNLPASAGTSFIVLEPLGLSTKAGNGVVQLKISRRVTALSWNLTVLPTRL